MAGRERALTEAFDDHSARPAPEGAFFMPETVIATDLLTPLGAYLRLRPGARGAFLLESVERGRLGRYSFVGRGSRLRSFDAAGALGEPGVGHPGYHAGAAPRPARPPPAG